MVCIGFAQITSSSFAGAAALGFVVCTLSPHPVAWLKIALVCVGVVSACVAVTLCAVKSANEHKTGLVCVTGDTHSKGCGVDTSGRGTGEKRKEYVVVDDNLDTAA